MWKEKVLMSGGACNEGFCRNPLNKAEIDIFLLKTGLINFS